MGPAQGPGPMAGPWAQNLENPVLTHRPPNEISRACPGSIFHFKILVLPKFRAGFGPFGPGSGLGLAGWAKIEGLGKVKYGGLEFVRAPNRKNPPWMDRSRPGDAQNLVFE